MPTMSGHQHPTKRCDTCEFWARGDQYPFDENAHHDDRVAACHRNAPRPTLGDFEYQLLSLISLIAWHVGDDDKNNEREFGKWEEATEQTVSWPGTTGSDWCGEWHPRAALTTGKRDD
jgi:hypothetical protein